MTTATAQPLHEALKEARPDGWEALRAAAEARAAEQELPTTRQEDWKYLDLSPLRELAFGTAPEASVDVRDAILTEAKGSRLVFVNGRYDAHHSCVSGLPTGVRLLPLSHATEAAPQLGALTPVEEGDLFANLNAARFTDGAYIYVPKGVKVETPLHLLFLNRAESPALVQTRVLVVLEKGAELELVEDHQGTGTYLSNVVVEACVADAAELRHERIQRESAEAFHVSTLRARVGRDGRYLSRTVTLGARLSRQSPQVLLSAEGADASLDGLALLNGRQVADTHSLLTHATPHGTSSQLHKCIVDDQARGVFNGRIVVAPHAQGTDSRQASRNLLLSPSARVDTKPQLEIYADDVKCSHGAAIGQLDPEELFYLQSRGIPVAAARNLLTYGFASDLIGRIPVASLRRQLRQAVMSRTHAAQDIAELV